MKKIILLSLSIMFSLLLSGCYLDDVSDYEYGIPSEEELARHQIWETYYDYEEIYLDKNLYDFEDIDWIEVLKQSPSFRRFYKEMDDYSFLVTVFVNTRQYLHNNYYRIQIDYSDQTTGYGTGFEVPFFDYSEIYETLYRDGFTLVFNHTELVFTTYMDDLITLEYGDTEISDSSGRENTFDFEFGSVRVTPKPLGYEIEVDNEIFFVYDMEIFPENDNQ